MLSHIPQNRLIIYFLALGILPVLIVFFIFITQEEEVRILDNTIENMQEKALFREKKQSVNMAVRAHYDDADHFYIDKHLETLSFLDPELESLHKLVANPNYVEDELVRKRIEYLSGPNNSLSFAEGVVEKSSTFQETAETLTHPVEINIADLQNILAKVEGVDIGPFHSGPNKPSANDSRFQIRAKSAQ